MKKQLVVASAMFLITIAISGALSAADTTWSVSASPDTIQSGQVLTYTVTITNNGQNILIWPGIDVLGLSPDLINPEVSWDGSDWIGCNLEQHYGFESISPGSSKKIYFRGTVKETTASSISSIFNLIDIDANLLDTKTVTTIVNQPFISMSVSDSPDPVKPGETVTYSVTMTNNGQEDWNFAMVYPTLSLELQNAQYSWDESQWFDFVPGGGTGSGTLQPGETVTVYFKGTVKPDTTVSSISSTFTTYNTPNTQTSTETTTVKQNQPPVPVIIKPITANEGSVIFDATGSYDPDGDTLQYQWKIGNGEWSEWSTSPKITFNLDYMLGTYYLAVSDGKVTIETCSTVTVNNVAPTALAGDDQTAIVGNTVSFSGSFTDPGTLDTHTYSWDFGDGSTPITGTLTPTHIFTQPGIYNVKLTVTDDDGGVGYDTMKVTVNPITVTADIKPGATPNTISIKSKGVIPVAILSTSTFDASNVNPLSVTFGCTGNEKSFVKYSWTDINGDSKIDLLLYFNTQKTGLTLSDTEAVLKGLTTTGLSFECRDSIKTVPK